MRRTIIASLFAFAAASMVGTTAQAQTLESLFAMCRSGYTYDASKNMCMLDKKAKKTSKKKVAKKKAKAKT